MTYADKLKDRRWQKKRLEVLHAAGWICEDCGSNEKTQLDVHHTAYVSGRNPWEYDGALLMCLCHECHEWRQAREDAFRVALGETTRFLKRDVLEMEVWDFLRALRLRQTERMASAFQ